jgi:hypothetical protein
VDVTAGWKHYIMRAFVFIFFIQHCHANQTKEVEAGETCRPYGIVKKFFVIPEGKIQF